MKKISRWLKLIATGSMSFILSACYGVMKEFDEGVDATVDLRVESEDGVIIPNLQVSYQYAGIDTTEYWSVAGLTNDSGIIQLDLTYYTDEMIYIKIEDIDEEVNGSFETKVIHLTDSTKVVQMVAL